MEKDAFRFSGSNATNYDEWLGPILFEPSAKEFLNFLGSPDIQSVLEISCGTGRLTRHLRKYFPATTKIIASDLSPDMLEVARKNLPDASLIFQIADAQQLPFEDNSFHLVVCQYGLMFLPDKAQGFNEAYRVLKPGGRFIFSTWDSQENIPFLHIIFNEILIPFFNDADPSRFRIPFSMYDPEKLLDYLTGAGFRYNRVFPVHFKSGISSVEHVANAFFLKHPLAREVAGRDPTALTPLANEIRKRIKAEFGSENIRFDLSAFIGIGEK